MKPTSKIVRHFKDHHHKILDVSKQGDGTWEGDRPSSTRVRLTSPDSSIPIHLTYSASLFLPQPLSDNSQELFIPFASIDPYVPIARRVPFMIEISGRNPNNTTHIILHPTYTIFGVQTFIVPGNGQQTQLMLSGQVAVPRTCKPLAWPLVTFKNLVRTPAKDIRGYHVYSFIRSIGSSPANDKIKSKITTTPAGKGLASGAEAETVPSLPQPEEDPIWSSVVVPNNKGPSSPWYAHCRQRKSDRVIFCAYCNHSYGLRAAWGSSDKKRKKKKGEDGGEGDADMKDGDDDEDEEMGDASDGENGEGSKEPPTPDSANPDSAKVKRSRDPNKVRNYLVKGGMTSNIKRHVLSLHSEELEADTWTGSFPPVDPADATLFAEFVKEAPPPWLADAKVAGDAVSAFLVHPTLSLLEFKATAAKDSFHLTGSFGAISRDRSTYDLLARYDNLEPRSQELNKVVTVHRFERVMEQKGLVAVSVVQMPTPPYERVIYVRHLRREDKKVEQAVPMDV